MQGKTSAPTLFVPQPDQDSRADLTQVRRGLWLGLTIILVVAVLAGYLVHWNLAAKEKELVATQAEKLLLMAGNRAELIRAWLQGLAEDGNRVTQSELFRLYASEIDLIEDDLSLLVTGALRPDRGTDDSDLESLAAQLPMMQNLLQEFTRYAGFLNGRVVNRNGQSYIATDANTTALSDRRRALAAETLIQNRPLFSPLYTTANGLVLDIFLPILPPMAEGSAAPPVAVLILSRVVSDKASEFVGQSPLTSPGHRTRLVQQNQGRFEELIPWLPEGVRALENDFKPGQNGQLAFADRTGLDQEQRVYSYGVQIPETDFWVVQEVDYYTARLPLSRFRQVAVSMVTLVSVLFLLTLGALWWRFVGSANEKLAGRFRDLARRTEEQRQLIDSINTSVTDGIALKNKGGIYQYVNPAFARALGRSEEEIIGMDDIALFGYDTAMRLEVSDQWVYQNHRPTTINEQIFLQSQLHYLQIAKTPYLVTGDMVEGIVSVYRDVTELMQAQEKSQKAIRQTVEALVSTIEMTDPYLAGHSRLMSDLATQVARALSADEQEVATVETAAFLSQIGKLFVPKDLLNKAEALTSDEKKALEAHADHAGSILRTIEFDLPIYDCITQMNEHIDGTGYPNGLKDGDIIRPARILAVTNAFCAMVKPRAYRPARDQDEALSILADSQGQYDKQIVDTLTQLVHSHEGEKLLRQGGD